MIKGSIRIVLYLSLILLTFSGLVYVSNTLFNSIEIAIILSLVLSLIFMSINKKRLRTALFSSNSGLEFKQMMFSLAEPVISTDKLGNIVRINRFAEAFTGYNYKEIRGKNISLVLNLYKRTPVSYEMYNPAAELYTNKLDFFKVAGLEIKDKDKRVHSVTALISKVKNEFGREKGAVITFTEVNEEQIKEYEILKSKRDINLLLSNMNEGFYLIDSNKKIRDWSLGAEEITGIQAKDVMNKSAVEVIPTVFQKCDVFSDITTDYEVFLHEAITTGDTNFLNKKIPLCIKTKAGKVKHIESYSFTIKNEEYYFLGNIIRDITEEKEYQARILQSEEKFNKIFDLSPIAIIIADLKSGEVYDLNKAFAELFLWTKDEIIGKTVIDFDFWSNESDRKKYLKEYYDKGYVEEFIVSFQNKLGAKIICSLSGSIIDVNGRKAIISYLIDISLKVTEKHQLELEARKLEEKVSARTTELETINENLNEQIYERMQIEEALRESEEKFRGLLEHLPIGVYRTNLNGEITQSNPKFREIIGYFDEREIKAMPFYALFVEAEKRTVQYYKSLSSNGFIKSEMMLRKRDGSGICVFINAQIIKSSGNENVIEGTIEDITERKNAEKALILSKEKYRNLFENLNDIYISFDYNGTLTEISPSFEKISGFNISDFIGKKIETILTYEEVNNYFLFAYKSIKEPANFTISIRNSQNKTYSFSLNLRPVFTKDSKTGFEGIARDITKDLEHNRITDTLYDISRAVNLTDSLDELFAYIHKALSNIIDTSNFFFAILDEEEDIIHFPYMVDEVDDLLDSFPLDTPDSYTAKVILSKKPILRRFEDIEQMANRRDDITGTYSLVWLGVPLQVKDKVIGAMVVQSYKDYYLYNESDIDLLQSVSDQVALAIDRKRTQIHIDNQYKFIQDLIDAIPNPVYYKDIKTKQYQRCNKAFAAHLNLRQEEIIGKTVFEIFPIEKALEFEVYDEDVVSGTGVQKYESSIKSSTDEIFTSLVYRTCYYDNSGHPVGIVGVIHNITESKKAQEEIQNALKKEQELNKLKSDFVSMVSHEYRTPLQAIMMSTELLKEYGSRFDEAGKNKQFERILNSINILNNMLDDILLLNKSERGKYNFNPQFIDISSYCHSLTKEMQFLAKDKCSIELLIENPEIRAYIDESIVHQLLTNLLSNAVKYSRKDGAIVFSVIMSETSIKFIIKDYGIGIPEKDREKLFEPFFRANNIGNISGTGLGLSIVKDAVELHNGKITFESEIGEGTTFYVTLPNQLPNGK